MAEDLPTLPLRGRVVNLLGETRALLKGDSYLDRSAVLEFAHRDTRLSDLGDGFDPRLLDVLLDSAATEANLTYLGRRVFYESLGTTLAVRLLFVEARNRHPEAFEGLLHAPMIVMGAPRTGTTLLQNLLALHPEFEALPNWELRRPIPLWALDRTGEDRRLEIARQWARGQEGLVRSTDHVHFARPTTPGECMMLLLITLRSIGFWNLAPVYSYVEALERDDSRTKYREYVALLHLLQKGRPDRRLVLKAPEHTAHLDRITELLPRAAIIQTHRDPARSAVSLLSLLRAQHANVVRRLDATRWTETTLGLLQLAMERNLEARDTCDDTIHDVGYEGLVSDPVGVVRGIYERFGVTWPNGHERRLQAYLQKNPKGKHGRHEYRASDFGLTEEGIRDRFSPYVARFGLAP